MLLWNKKLLLLVYITYEEIDTNIEKKRMDITREPNDQIKQSYIIEDLDRLTKSEARLGEKEKQLREKEKQLRKEKEQLRKEKEQLRKEKEQLREQLRNK